MVSFLDISEQKSKLESFKDLFDKETARYLRKGYGLIPSIFIPYMYFFILPDIIKNYYHYLPTDNFFLMFVGGSMLIHITILVVFNLLLYFIYKLEHPFFEKNKISIEPWP